MQFFGICFNVRVWSVEHSKLIFFAVAGDSGDDFGDIPLDHTAKIIELIKPKVLGGRTESAIVEITSRPWAKTVATF